MHQCTNCGATLKTGQNRCDICGAETPYHKTQRVCMNCGAPAAQGVKTCMMCGQPVDALPQKATSFGASWLGVLIGLAIVGGVVAWFLQIELPQPVSSAPALPPTATPFFIPPTNTPTPTVTPTLPPTPTLSPTPTPTPKPLIHTIKTGETLNLVANKYNVSLADLEQVNNITQDSILQVGQELIIPFATDADAAASADSRERPIILYTVKSGDTLSGIAFEYDTSIAAIEVANPGLDLDILSVGQEILVPLRPPTFTPTPTITPTPTFTPRPPFLTPMLLYPQDDALIEGDTSSVLLNWTSSGTLNKETYYVVYLSDNAGQFKTFATRATSYRLLPELRPAQLTTWSWYVVVMKKIGIDAEGVFYGKALSNPSKTQTFRWR